jgi:hypothetical protein
VSLRIKIPEKVGISRRPFLNCNACKSKQPYPVVRKAILEGLLPPPFVQLILGAVVGRARSEVKVD